MSQVRLWQAISKLLQAWPLSHVEILADRVDGMVTPTIFPKSLKSPEEKEVYAAWSESGLSGTALAAALRSSAYVRREHMIQQKLHLVWTGPDTPTLPLRSTEVVLNQVIQRAVQHLLLVSFVAYEVPSVVAALQEAMQRGVKVSIVLEAPTTLGGSLTVNSVANMYSVLPEARIYVWDGGNGGIPGVIHAKCAVADATAAFVTSANLTGSAMWRNMELGVLIEGGDQPRQLKEHFDALMSTRILMEV